MVMDAKMQVNLADKIHEHHKEHEQHEGLNRATAKLKERIYQGELNNSINYQITIKNQIK